MDEFNNNEKENIEAETADNNQEINISGESQQETISSETTAVSDREPPKFNIKKEILDWTFSIVIAVVIALLIRTYIFTLVRVDGPSMNPTLTHGDTLYTNRFMYTPDVGDIIIFRPPNSPSTPYVKRVIAVAGQTVEVNGENHTVKVDGKVLDEPYIAEPLNSGGTMKYPCTVPDGYIFVMGDNRNNSRDSRDASVGLIPLDNVIGKAMFRLLPIKNFGSLY